MVGDVTEHQQRRCLGCRKSGAKSSLHRFVLIDGRVVLDFDGRRGGRGAYLHCSASCVKVARDRRCWERAFRLKGGTLQEVELTATLEKFLYE